MSGEAANQSSLPSNNYMTNGSSRRGAETQKHTQKNTHTHPKTIYMDLLGLFLSQADHKSIYSVSIQMYPVSHQLEIQHCGEPTSLRPGV